MPNAVTLIRSPNLSDAAESRLIFLAGACQVSVLGYKDQLVEIEATAAVLDA